jgi:Na+-transporting NADH:ubiquinone oxidoreductase subunit C
VSSPKKSASNIQVIGFIVVLSFTCALILSVLSSVLEKPKAIAKELDRSEQMLMASKIYSPNGYFLLKTSDGQYYPAKYGPKGVLVKGKDTDFPTSSNVLATFKKRIQPILIDKDANVKTFEEAGIDEAKYMRDNKKMGYANLKEKLAYKILANPKEGEKESKEIEGYVFPVNGFGLWDAIYGYVAVSTDGDTVIGISWYQHMETPGLGANISEPSWQAQFPGKKIFEPSSDGSTNVKTAPLGITVVRGKVEQVIGTGPKSESYVDGMAGATLTGNGVTSAYKDSLEPYRPFLVKLNESNKKS